MNSSCFFYLVLFFFGRLFASHSYSSSYQYCNCNSAYVTCTQTIVSSSVDHDNCTILDLSGLSLNFLPQLVNFTQVQSLNISFNNITQIEDHKLTTLCSLQEIYAEGNPFGCPCDDIPISLSMWDYITDNATLRCPSTFGAEGHFTLFNYSSFCPGGSNATHWYYDCQESRSHLVAQYNASLVDANMTVDMCVSQCDMEGHNYAELFNGTNCYCETSIFGDFTIVNRGALGKGICNITCPGDSTEVCGGRNSLSIYQADKSCLRVPPSDRIDCSYEWPDIPNYICVQRGCCYDSTYPQAIKCFYKAKQSVHNSCDAVGSFSSSSFAPFTSPNMNDRLTLFDDFLDATEPMSCNGLLVAWEFKVSGMVNCTFKVWRSTGGRFLSLAGSTNVSLNANSSRYNLQPDKQIAVMKGDMIGAYHCYTLHLDESQQPAALYVNRPSRSNTGTFFVDESNEIEVGSLSIRTQYYRLHLRAIINASADIPTDQPATNSTPSVQPTLRPVASFCHTSSSPPPPSSSGSLTIRPTVTHSHPLVSQGITTLSHTPSPMHRSSISTATTVAISIEPTLGSPGGSSGSSVSVLVIAIIAACVGVFVLVLVLIIGVAIGRHTAKRRRTLSLSSRHSGASLRSRSNSVPNPYGDITMVNNPMRANSSTSQLVTDYSYATTVTPPKPAPRVGTNENSSSEYLSPPKVVGGHVYSALDLTKRENPSSVYGHRTDTNGQGSYVTLLEASSETKQSHYEDLAEETLEPKHVYGSTAKDVKQSHYEDLARETLKPKHVYGSTAKDAN